MRANKYPLRSDEKPQYMYEFYATGRGRFPFDMLRYDSCWPATGEDANLLDESTNPRANRGRLTSTKMHSYREPTPERWTSFLWSIGTERLFGTPVFHEPFERK